MSRSARRLSPHVTVPDNLLEKDTDPLDGFIVEQMVKDIRRRESERMSELRVYQLPSTDEFWQP